MKNLSFTYFAALSLFVLSMASCGADQPEGANLKNIRYTNKPIATEKRNVRLSSFKGKPYRRAGEDLPYDLFMPKENFAPSSAKLLVVVHEGAFVKGDKNQFLVQKLSKSLARRGHATAAVSYRKVMSQLRNPKGTIVDAMLDVKEVTRHIQTQTGFKPENTYIVGYSAGGIIAAHLALSQPEELTDYAHDPAFKNVDGNTPFAGVVSIAGGLLDYNHIQDEDLDDLRMLLIHGTEDEMVPYTRGLPLGDLVDSDLVVNSPVTVHNSTGSSIWGTFSIGSGTLELARDLFLSEEICGSKCIMDEFVNNPNLTFLTVKNGPHNLFYNNEKGELNGTYKKIVNEIDEFVEAKNRRSAASG